MPEDRKRGKGRGRLEDLTAAAVEAEADQDRHRMEEAVLATAARSRTEDPFHWTFLKVFPGRLSFSRSDLAAVALAVRSCMEEWTAPDEVIIRGKLKAASANVKDAVLRGILDGSKAVDGSVAEAYVRKMDDQDRFRRADAAGHRFLSEVERVKVEGGDADIAFGHLAKTVFDLAQSKDLVAEYPVEAAEMPDFLESLAKRRAGGRDWLGLDCGFRHLNEVLNGLGEGVFVFAGAPSCGKTTLVKQIADHVAAVEKVPVLFWSFEQSKEELRIKSLSRLAAVDSRDIWKGRSGLDTWKKVEEAADTFCKGAGRFLQVIEAGRADTLDRIRVAALMAKHKAGDKPILLVIDYLQIIPAAGSRFDSIREKIDWHLSELRRLARDLKSPVLVVSSENRQGYAGNPVPTLAVLKESGGIEYSADAVICLWRDDKESENLTRTFERKTVRVELHVLKNRNGELAKVKLDFTPAWSVFDNETRADRISWSDALGK